MLSQRAGVFNLGLEGIMLMGAFTGFYVTYVSQSPLLGLLAAIITGGLMGLLMAFVSVTLQAEQGISGIGLSMLGWGLSGLFFRLSTASSRLPASRLGKFPDWVIFHYLGRCFSTTM